MHRSQIERSTSSLTSIIVSSRNAIAPLLAHPNQPEGTTSLISVAARGAYAVVLMGGPMSLNSAWPHDPEKSESPHRRGVVP
jgi:hypothetical protein